MNWLKTFIIVLMGMPQNSIASYLEINTIQDEEIHSAYRYKTHSQVSRRDAGSCEKNRRILSNQERTAVHSLLNISTGPTIYQAARSGWTNEIIKLHYQGVNLLSQNEKSYAPLHEAIDHFQEEVVRSILDLNPKTIHSVAWIDRTGTPIDHALQIGDPKPFHAFIHYVPTNELMAWRSSRIPDVNLFTILRATSLRDELIEYDSCLKKIHDTFPHIFHQRVRPLFIELFADLVFYHDI